MSLLSGCGIETAIATVSSSFVAEALARAVRLHPGSWRLTRGNGITGRFTGHFEPEDKVTFGVEQCQRFGVGLDQVVAIGDGRSDLALFHAVGFSVAINASSAGARSAASANVESQSFRCALTAVP